MAVKIGGEGAKTHERIYKKKRATARAIPVYCLCPALIGLEFFFSVAEPKKEKTEQSANGAVSPSGEPQPNQGTATTGSLPISAAPPNSGDQQKPSRPNTLEARVVARRLILFDSEYIRYLCPQF